MLQTDFSKEIMLSRYAYPGETTWGEIVERVASHVSKVELNGEVIKWKDEFYNIIQPGDFIPGGRILYGSGRRNGSLLNCFVLGVDDNRHSIAKLSYDMYLISVSGGGLGVSYSKIRPKGDPIQNIDGAAPGVISEIKKIDAIGEQVRSGGGRRTALLALLSIEHPDVLEFINVKTNLNELNNHNISIAVTKKFVGAVKKNKPWKFYFGNKEYKLWEFKRTNPDGRRKEENIIVPGVTREKAEITANTFYKQHFDDTFEFINEKELMAKDLWHSIISNNLKSGEPGFIFIDNIEENFNANYFESFVSTNPCGEITLPQYGSCCLGSINVANFYNEKKNDVDWSRLAKTIHVAVRFLDNVLTVNHYPIPETNDSATKSRRIGLGIMGLHYLLIKLGMKYGKKKSLEFIERFFATIRNESYDASIELAKEKGPFSEFDRDEFLRQPFVKRLPTRLIRKIKKYGIRGASLNTIPPTGCLIPSTTIQTDSGTLSLEQIFSRNNISLQDYEKSYNKWFIPFDDIKVETTAGLKGITKLYINGIAKTKKIILDSGDEIEGTDNHKVLVLDDGKVTWRRLDKLKKNDKILTKK